MLDLFQYKIEGIIEKFVHYENKGKGPERNTKEAIKKMAHKQMLWRIYKHTGNVEDYTNYKETLNLATTEIRKSKTNFEKKIFN